MKTVREDGHLRPGLLSGTFRETWLTKGKASNTPNLGRSEADGRMGGPFGLLGFAARAAKQRAPTQVTAYAGHTSTAEGLPGFATRADEQSAQDTKTMTLPRGLVPPSAPRPSAVADKTR